MEFLIRCAQAAVRLQLSQQYTTGAQNRIESITSKNTAETGHGLRGILGLGIAFQERLSQIAKYPHHSQNGTKYRSGQETTSSYGFD